MTAPARKSAFEGGAHEGSVREDIVISDRYRLEAEIGAGGMARVWRAHDLTLDRPVAVKFLFLREDRDQQTMIDRFLREARIAASVRHPNVVDVLDFGTMPADGRPFMVMELLEGESLDDRLGREPTLPVVALVELLASALDGLLAVHKVGIVHRDLKPDNIFLLESDDGIRPKLLDFGVSRDTDASSGRRSALTTNAGYLVGTPEYMSPEQARGLKDIDWRTDLYSVGVLLYEALTGQLPYDAEAVGDLIIDIVGGEASPAVAVRRDIGAALSDVVAKAMASSRDDRFQSAKEMREALLGAVEEGGLEDLHTLVPARKTVAANISSPSLNSLDGKLAWGADAVPSFGAPTAEVSSEQRSVSADAPAVTDPGVTDPGERTPRANAQSSESELVPVRPPSKRPLWIAVAVALPLLGLALWVLQSNPDAPVEAPIVGAQPSRAGLTDDTATDHTATDHTATDGTEPSRVVATDHTATDHTATDHTATDDAEPSRIVATPPSESPDVTITLTDLPGNARVFVDNVHTPVENGLLVIARDDARHQIRVEAPRRLPWTTGHRATEGGSYRVQLQRRPSSRRGRRTGTGVFTDLDY